MAEKVFTIDYKFAGQDMSILENINELILQELEADRPVYASIPTGTFRGTIARLKIGKRSIDALSTLFCKSRKYGINIDRGFVWDLEVDGSNRTFHINWYKAFANDYRSKNKVQLYIGRTAGTEVVRAKKGERDELVDFLGNPVADGDYVLVYNSPKELKDTGSPMRMLRYTGKRSDMQAVFTYVSLANGKKNPDGGQQIRVGLNISTKDKSGISNQIYGVKVEVEENLTVAMQMTDHDMSIYPLKFSVAMAE